MMITKKQSTNAPFGHNYDWEWAVVKWERTPGDRNYWQRKSIVLAAHGNKQEWKWADYPRTNKPGYVINHLLPSTLQYLCTLCLV